MNNRTARGTPPNLRGIPVRHDARGGVETVRAGSAMDAATGHYVVTAAEHETVRSCADGKPQEARRNDAPARRSRREVTDRFRNKLPRPQGQGTMRQEKVITGISGSARPAARVSSTFRSRSWCKPAGTMASNAVADEPARYRRPDQGGH